MVYHESCVTVLFLIRLDFFCAVPVPLRYTYSPNYIANDLGFQASKKIIPYPCKNEKECNSVGERLYRINQNYALFLADKGYRGKFSGFDILNRPYKGRYRFRRNAINTKDWPKSKDGLIYIPFSINDYATATRITASLKKASKEFEKHTCFRLIPRTNEIDYVHIVDYNGCWSLVGKTGGKQYMSLSQGCEGMAIILHEFMHAIGFYHEQSRRDRDQHIKINWTNIHEHNHDQFRMLSYGSVFVHGRGFDIHSIMQYGRKAGALNIHFDAMSPIKFPDANLGAKKGDSFSYSDKVELNLKGLCGFNITVYGGPYANKDNWKT